MKVRQHAERRVVAYPPDYIKEKLDRHLEKHGGSRSEFITDAIKEKLETIRASNIKTNSVSNCL